MLLAIILSYVAGFLTVLAPCILPMLPIVLGGSFDTEQKDNRRTYTIIASLIVSVLLFTLLLKASTSLIGIDSSLWAYFSGGLIIGLGVFMLFPGIWARITVVLGFEHKTQSALGRAAAHKNGTIAAILTGAALGPVFSSCSPTYAWVLATVLPANAALGLVYLTMYTLGLATALLAIALMGRRAIKHVAWASDPKGWFQRTIAIIFILVGLFIITGLDKSVQTWLVERDFLNLIELEQRLVPES